MIRLVLTRRVAKLKEPLTHHAHLRLSPPPLIAGRSGFFFWSLALFFIAFLSYKIFFKSGVFVRKKKPLAEPEENSLLELNELSEYDFAISEAENKNEFNVALRYLFLKTLKTLSDKGDINFAAEKTNSDYLIQMSHHTNFEDFKRLTHNYEYVWYGKFFIDKEQYQELKKDFNSFNKNL